MPASRKQDERSLEILRMRSRGCTTSEVARRMGCNQQNVQDICITRGR